MKKALKGLFVSISIATIYVGVQADALDSHLIFSATYEKVADAVKSSGNPKPVKIEGVKYEIGKKGSGILIENNAVCVYETKNNFNPKAGTLMMWIKRKGDSDTFFTIGKKWYKEKFFTFRIIESQKKIQAIFKKDSKTTGNVTCDKMQNKNSWHHYAVTWGNGEIKLYINGKLMDKNSMSDYWDKASFPAEMNLGSSGDGRYQANSVIDEVMIYDVPLTQKQLAEKANPAWLKKLKKELEKKDKIKNSFTWRDWNATPTPKEGKSVKDPYPFAEIFFTDQKFHRIEFNAPKKISDAWLVFYSYMNVPATHKVGINDTLNFEHRKSEGRFSPGKLAIVPAKGIKEGKNVLWMEAQWCSVKLIINFIDGSQEIIASSPKWRSTNTRLEGWRKPGYDGISEETQYRLGREGYHIANNPFTCHPYVGLIDLKENRPAPIYKEGETFELDVSIPNLFYGKDKPELIYQMTDCFGNAKKIVGKGKFIDLKDGRAHYKIFEKLRFAGAFDLEISFGDKAAMKRTAELVVVGPIEQPVVSNASELISSLDLKLLDSIDCANERTPPIEGGPTPGGIVEKDGLKYFETGTATGFLAGPGKVDYAMWKLSPEELNDWHLLEVDIPEDKNRVQIIAIVHNNANREFGVESTIEIGAPRPLSNNIYTHRMLFIPKQKDVRVIIAPSPRITNSRNGAAVKAIRFYKIKGLLPRLKLGNSGRMNANYNERTDLIGVSHYPGSDNFSSSLQFMASRQYRRWYLAIKKHIEYSRFIGQNAVCHGLYQYVREEYPTESDQTKFVKLMLEMYNANGISYYCNNEYFTSEVLEGKKVGHKVKKIRISDEEVAHGKDTYRLVSFNGKQARGFQFNNPCHPAVKADILRIVKDIASKYAVSPAFKGMMVFAGTMGCAVNFRGPEWGYGDFTYKLFKRESCSKAPDFSGAKRFKMRYDWIKANAWQKWLDFRCRKVYELNKAMIDEIKKYSPNSKLIVNICAWPWGKNIGSGTLQELRRKLIGSGTDVKLFAGNPDMLLMHNDWMGQHIKEEDLYFVEKYNRNKKIWDYVTQKKPCGVFFWTGFYEMRLFLPEAMQNQYWLSRGWLNINSEKRFIGSAGKSGRNYLSAFSNAFAYANPIFFANRFTDVAEHRGFLNQRAEAAQFISYIPKGDYKVQAGSTDECILKRNKENAYIVNNICHESILELKIKGSDPVVKNTVNNLEYELNEIGGGLFSSPEYYILTIEMKPYQMLALKLENVESIEMKSIKK